MYDKPSSRRTCAKFQALLTICCDALLLISSTLFTVRLARTSTNENAPRTEGRSGEGGLSYAAFRCARSVRKALTLSRFKNSFSDCVNIRGPLEVSRFGVREA